VSAQSSTDVIIRIDTIDQLFNAPSSDPFSDKPAVILGEPALQHCVRQELKHRSHNWQGKRLVIELPADQVTSDVTARTPEAIRRYAAAKRLDNDALVRISRTRALVGLGVAIGIAAALLVVVGVALSTFLASISDLAKAAITGVVTIFCWATVWNPWDRLVYDWVEPWMENRILRSIATMEIVVCAEADHDLPRRDARS
jgi:hypothetical protein